MEAIKIIVLKSLQIIKLNQAEISKMSFRFRFSQDSQGEDLGFSSSSPSSQPSQEMTTMPSLLSQSQSQSFMPRQSSYASRIRNLQLQSDNQRKYGGRESRILSQQR